MLYFTLILPGKLTENTLSFTTTTWEIVTGEMKVDKLSNLEAGDD
jgi:hypothetical protein